MSNIEIPKIAQKFVADAEAAGMDVKVTAHNEREYAIHVVSGGNEVGVSWSRQTVYDEPASAGRLPFRTSSIGAREAVRFNYAEGRNWQGWQSPRSVRGARAVVGLPVS